MDMGLGGRRKSEEDRRHTELWKGEHLVLGGVEEREREREKRVEDADQMSL